MHCYFLVLATFVTSSPVQRSVSSGSNGPNSPAVSSYISKAPSTSSYGYTLLSTNPYGSLSFATSPFGYSTSKISQPAQIAPLAGATAWGGTKDYQHSPGSTTTLDNVQYTAIANNLGSSLANYGSQNANSANRGQLPSSTGGFTIQTNPSSEIDGGSSGSSSNTTTQSGGNATNQQDNNSYSNVAESPIAQGIQGSNYADTVVYNDESSTIAQPSSSDSAIEDSSRHIPMQSWLGYTPPTTYF